MLHAKNGEDARKKRGIPRKANEGGYYDTRGIGDAVNADHPHAGGSRYVERA